MTCALHCPIVLRSSRGIPLLCGTLCPPAALPPCSPSSGSHIFYSSAIAVSLFPTSRTYRICFSVLDSLHSTQWPLVLVDASLLFSKKTWIYFICLLACLWFASIWRWEDNFSGVNSFLPLCFWNRTWWLEFRNLTGYVWGYWLLSITWWQSPTTEDNTHICHQTRRSKTGT